MVCDSIHTLFRAKLQPVLTITGSGKILTYTDYNSIYKGKIETTGTCVWNTCVTAKCNPYLDAGLTATL